MAQQVFGIRADMRTIKRQFLDRRNVTEQIDRRTRRPLARFGGLVRTISRRSMRAGNNRPAAVSQYEPELRALIGSRSAKNADIAPLPRKRSQPGKPPLYHTRTLKDRIFFVADVRRRSVIIGPQISGSGDVPGTLEFGGYVNAEAKQWVSFWSDGQRRIRLASKGRRRVKIKPRPFMGPAYDAAVDRLIPDIFRV